MYTNSTEAHSACFILLPLSSLLSLLLNVLIVTWIDSKNFIESVVALIYFHPNPNSRLRKIQRLQYIFLFCTCMASFFWIVSTTSKTTLFAILFHVIPHHSRFESICGISNECKSIINSWIFALRPDFFSLLDSNVCLWMFYQTEVIFPFSLPATLLSPHSFHLYLFGAFLSTWVEQLNPYFNWTYVGNM